VKDFEYLDKLGLAEKRRQEIIQAGVLKQAAQMYVAIQRAETEWGKWLYPVTVGEAKQVLLSLMEPAEREQVLKSLEPTTADKVFGCFIGGMLLFLLGFMMFGGCQSCARQVPFLR
jgi:hypothetical protein